MRIYWRLGPPEEARALGFEPMILLTGPYIHETGARDTGRWTRRERTDQFIQDRIPRDYAGCVALDWEGVGLRILADPDHPQFQAVRSDFLELLWHVKRQRPRAQVGYYGLPFREYWNQDEAWKRRNDAVRSIMAAGDVVLPSCYDFYGDAPQRDAERFGRMIAESLRLAAGKPVIAWIRPQYHQSTEKWGHKRIPDEELIAHVRSLMAVEVEKDRIDGVCVFGSIVSSYTNVFAQVGGRWRADKPATQRARAFFDTEMHPGESIEAFHRRWTAHVACVIEEAVRGTPCHDGYRSGQRGATGPPGDH